MIPLSFYDLKEASNYHNKELNKPITDVIAISNLHQIFLCQLPPRFNDHNVNSEVSLYNELLKEQFLNTEELFTELCSN